MEVLRKDRLNCNIYKISLNKNNQIEIVCHAFITGKSFEKSDKYQIELALEEINTGKHIKLRAESEKLEFLKEDFYDGLDYRYSGFIARSNFPYWLYKKGQYQIKVKLIADYSTVSESIDYCRIENLGAFSSMKKRNQNKFSTRLVNNTVIDMMVKPIIIIKQDIKDNDWTAKLDFVSDEFKDIINRDDFIKTDLWLFNERESQAQDNARALFEYVIDNHGDINAKYAITLDEFKLFDKKYQKHLIEYGSKEHLSEFVSAKYRITTHPGYDNPFKHNNCNSIETYLFDTIISPKLNFQKLIMIQHGYMGTCSQFITSAYSMYTCPVHKIVTSNSLEEENLIKNFNFKEKNFIKSGLARWDNLSNKSGNEIFLFLHWDKNMADESYNFKLNDVKDSEFMRKVIELVEELEKNKIATRIKFHNQFEFSIIEELEDVFRKYYYVNYCSSNNFTKIINEAKLIVTDKSSITSDFLYLEKPVIKYFHKVEEYDILNKIPVTNDVDELVSFIKSAETTTNPFYNRPHCAKIMSELLKEKDD